MDNLPDNFFALGALRFSAVDNLPVNDVSNFAGQSVQISGVIREEPLIKKLPNGLTQVRFVVDVQGKMSGGMILTYYPKEGDELPTARIGDKISASGNLKLLTNYNNPGQIDGGTLDKKKKTCYIIGGLSIV